ncbi:phosphatase PAP2 family protein [Ectothiorhodospira lacustris]|uniref:phosphatase PAP2 family protein n=1 Tax=Ectothiorhodospira lacustris TaxID=2899127 RepID=UPI001EE8CA68|nr:phosphatase PAP2 family protein [Ectothiorhodospira lacustris]MCG5499947.1 phosphatase PAP2 family protein [Ectothiorhodospira lacustris]MCG5508866.1 phosphatase PAP2 family protein [Ectothiorhodospira lacustris]MCG5520657.1 phosphatase PAP2 family protein [Ectothiorhodospira lacustris]
MGLIQRVTDAEIPVCLVFNRMGHRRLINRVFAVVSRLGDGVFWYTLMLCLPLIHGMQALHVSLHMALVGLLCLPIYKILKATTGRDRPFRHSRDISLNVAPLDRFSFPSGHTLHAVAFTVVLLAWLPVWAWLVLPFTLMVALSRLVLGLHYPTDVLAGAAIGAAVALGSLWWMGGVVPL